VVTDHERFSGIRSQLPNCLSNTVWTGFGIETVITAEDRLEVSLDYRREVLQSPEH